MILSHKHKFIYIKTFKTGSTSIETALSAVCGRDDVITEASEQLRGHRQQAAQNYRIEHPVKPQRSLIKRVLLRPEKHYHPTVGYYEHMPAWRIRTYCGEDVWRNYFKFTFERNPWDRQVSWYHYKTKNRSERFKPSFSRFNRDAKRAYVENWDLYTMEDDGIVADFVGRYESLDADFETVLERIGLAGQVQLPRVNVNKKRRDGAEIAYREYYTDADRYFVARTYAREIEHFGYEF
jgi:hypothetical protein